MRVNLSLFRRRKGLNSPVMLRDVTVILTRCFQVCHCRRWFRPAIYNFRNILNNRMAYNFDDEIIMTVMRKSVVVCKIRVCFE